MRGASLPIRINCFTSSLQCKCFLRHLCLITHSKEGMPLFRLDLFGRLSLSIRDMYLTLLSTVDQIGSGSSKYL